LPNVYFAFAFFVKLQVFVIALGDKHNRFKTTEKTPQYWNL